MKSLILVIVAAISLIGCATDTGDAAKDRRGRVTNAVLESIASAVGKVAISTLTNAATQQMSGGKVDLASAASQGLWTNATSIVDSNTVAKIVNAWSDDSIKPVAAIAAQKFAEVNPQTPAEKVAVVNAIATGISNATTAAPIK